MLVAKTIAANIRRTSVNFANFHFYPSLTTSITRTIVDVKKGVGDKRVNSVKLLTDQAEDNTEPSRKCIFGRCNDYRRSLVSLIPGMNARLERDDIVCSA